MSTATPNTKPKPTAGPVLLFSNLSEQDQRITKSNVLQDKLTRMASTLLYTDLLSGKYNQKYENRLKALEEAKSSGRADGESQIEFPPHMLDKILDSKLSLRPTLFSELNNTFLREKTMDRGSFERSLYEVCVLQKHAFIKKYRQELVFTEDRVQTRNYLNSLYNSHFYKMLFLTNTLGIIFIYFAKLYRNSKALMAVVPLFAYGSTAMYCRLKYPNQVFDDISKPLATPAIEQERQDIINQCLLGDFSLSLKAMKEEVEMCKPPTDYIYQTLLM